MTNLNPLNDTFPVYSNELGKFAKVSPFYTVKSVLDVSGDLVANYNTSTGKVELSFSASSKADAATTITGSGMASGGGSLAADRIIDVDINDLPAATGIDGANDYLAMFDVSGNAHAKATMSQIVTAAGAASFLPLGGGTLTGALELPVGSAPAPSLRFGAGDGIYSPAAGEVAIARGSTEAFRVGAAGSQVTGDLTITGNLNVAGGQTIVSSTDLQVTDNEIVLNNGEAGAGVSAGTAGIRVDRGTANDAIIQFDEASDKWQMGIQGSLTDIHNSVNTSGMATGGGSTDADITVDVSIDNLTAFAGVVDEANDLVALRDVSAGTEHKISVSALLSGSLGNYLPLTGGTLTGSLIVPDGAVAAPAMRFAGGEGFYRSAAGQLALAIGGAKVAEFAATGLTITDGLTISGANFLHTGSNFRTNDPIPLINNGEAGATISGGFGGIEIDRGTGTSARIGYSETDSAFVAGLSGSEKRIQIIATRGPTPHTNPIIGDEWINSADETRYIRTTDGVREWWLNKDGSGYSRLGDLLDVNNTAPATGDRLVWNGSVWAPDAQQYGFRYSFSESMPTNVQTVISGVTVVTERFTATMARAAATITCGAEDEGWWILGSSAISPTVNREVETSVFVNGNEVTRFAADTGNNNYAPAGSNSEPVYLNSGDVVTCRCRHQGGGTQTVTGRFFGVKL